MSSGEITFKFLKKHILKTDKKWTLESKNKNSHYKWFPNQFCQELKLIKGIKEIITIKTDILSGVELNNQNIEIIADLLFTSTTSSLIYDEGKLSLHCYMTMSEPGEYWEPVLLGEAALMQIAEATYSISKIAKVMGAKEIYCEHPQSGPRLLLDSNIEKRIAFSVENGKEATKWAQEEFEQILNKGLIEPPATIENQGPQSLSVEFPFGTTVSLCKLTSQTRHPRIGNGLTIIQSFPLQDMPTSEGVNLCLNLNKKEADSLTQTYGFGSYCYRRGMINHICFIPNLAHAPNMLPELYKSCVTRAKHMSEEFTGHNW
jgi:hypothetical protein